MFNSQFSVYKVMIIAGEASGDVHGANLVNAIHKKNKDISFYGIGGSLLKAAGVNILLDASNLSVVGITEVFSKISEILRGISMVKNYLRTQRPDLLILIDFPDFNLHIAATAKRLNIPVLYYISPQIWAWRKGRVNKIASRVDHIAVILPFEAGFYRKHKNPVTFVGHPLLDELERIKSKVQHQVLPAKAQALNYIGLLPGSRHGEITRHFPIMLETARILLSQEKDLKFIISIASSVQETLIKNMIASHSSDLSASHFLLTKGVEEAFQKSAVIIAASGTVTLEAAIAGVPTVVIYKVSPLSYLVGKAMIKVKYISLVNLIAGKALIPELIQDQASPENIAECVLKMIKNPEGLKRMREELFMIRYLLGNPGASDRVAEIALNLLQTIK